MTNYPPPQSGYGPPPPGYGPPHRNAPRGNANGVLAAVVAGAVIVVGVVTTVLLVTGDANSDVRAGLGTASGRPTGSVPPTGSGRPTGPGSGGRSLPTGQTAPTGGPSIPEYSSDTGGVDLTEATSTGNDYFDDLDVNFYYSAQGDWCDESAFPLTPTDVASVSSASALGAAEATGSQASMQGEVSFEDGRSGTLTIYLRPEDSAGNLWCITSQSSLS